MSRMLSTCACKSLLPTPSSSRVSRSLSVASERTQLTRRTQASHETDTTTPLHNKQNNAPSRVELWLEPTRFVERGDKGLVVGQLGADLEAVFVAELKAVALALFATVRHAVVIVLRRHVLFQVDDAIENVFAHFEKTKECCCAHRSFDSQTAPRERLRQCLKDRTLTLSS